MASTPTRLHMRGNDAHFRRCVSQKVGFRTKEQALDSAEGMMARGLVNPGCHITPYECKDCREWHLANRVIVPMPWSGHREEAR